MENDLICTSCLQLEFGDLKELLDHNDLVHGEEIKDEEVEVVALEAYVEEVDVVAPEVEEEINDEVDNTSIPEVVEDLSSLDISSDKAERLAHHNNGLDNLDISLRNRDPDENVQGSFSLAQLRMWKDYFPSDLKIWSYYGNVKETILLHSALKRRTKDAGKISLHLWYDATGLRLRSWESRLADLDKIIDQGKGDENSKYFHGIINKKRSQLTIRGVLVDSDWIDDPSCVKNEFLKHFSNWFAPLTPKLSFQSQFPNRVTPEQIDVLESIVLMMKLKELWDCGINKSPGPNGISFELYRKYWDIINQDVVVAATSFWDDIWAVDSPLKRLFLRLYLLESNKCCSVAAKLRDSSLISSFRRPHRGGIEDDQLRLLEGTISPMLLSQSSDRWTWRLESSGDFSVKSS
nr:RNA-directed DNA polymerase, eukaryota [Tanacetum cinerariifolium]